MVLELPTGLLPHGLSLLRHRKSLSPAQERRGEHNSYSCLHLRDKHLRKDPRSGENATFSMIWCSEDRPEGERYRAECQSPSCSGKVQLDPKGHGTEEIHRSEKLSDLGSQDLLGHLPWVVLVEQHGGVDSEQETNIFLLPSGPQSQSVCLHV